jgi:hypothetical protein
MFGRSNNKKVVVYKNDEHIEFKILENIKILETKKSVSQVNWIAK